MTMLAIGIPIRAMLKQMIQIMTALPEKINKLMAKSILKASNLC